MKGLMTLEGAASHLLLLCTRPKLKTMAMQATINVPPTLVDRDQQRRIETHGEPFV
jgi:hypothetical protein